MEKKMKAINVAKVPVVLIAMILMLRGFAFGQGGWTDDGSTVRLTTSSDKVGIGTASPLSNAKLDVKGDIYSTGTNPDIFAYYNASNYIRMHHNSGHTYFDFTGGNVYWRDNAGATKFFIQDFTGRIGMSTTAPLGMLDIRGTSNTVLLRTQTSGGEVFWVGGNGGNVFMGGYSTGDKLQLTVENNVKMTITTSGNVGIGTTSPARELEVNGRIRISHTDARLEIFDTTGDNFRIQNQNGIFKIINATDADREDIVIDGNGNVGIGTTNPLAKLDVAGTTRTKIIEITGGSDLAEPFEIAGTESVKPGIVVCIDPDQPGKLRVCGHAYDNTVAGIISGAGGLNPGILMTQSSAEANGKYPVALTGRVYVWADATNSSIKPGELLTTSGTPGHAMKATDYSKAQGAIVGKAMSSLENGRGLVLLLVALQ